ncbi:hypothetical protein DFH28DRAFT_889804 [Melampsora americana]|nr:hypothetical protein DFH28DRAFT_889804 [Melampsora americana]
MRSSISQFVYVLSFLNFKTILSSSLNHAISDRKLSHLSRRDPQFGFGAFRKGQKNGKKATPAKANQATPPASNGNAQNNDAQTSLTLDPKEIQTGSAQDGNPTGGQVASLTSTNNFINFCISPLALGAPLMNGTQTKATQSCNPIPMGMMASQNNMPSGKFTNPVNLSTIKANKTFDITMKIKNLNTGNFVNAATNYFSAPAQIDPKNGNVIGHSHFVIEAIDSLTSTTVTNPLQFAFFKGQAAVNGVLTVNVPGGLPAGTYRLGSINSAANHQPVLATIAQHGMFDDSKSYLALQYFVKFNADNSSFFLCSCVFHGKVI